MDSGKLTGPLTLLLENVKVEEAYWDWRKQTMVYRVTFTADRTAEGDPHAEEDSASSVRLS